MASIHKQIGIGVPADRLWDAVRDVGALHTRLVTGFVTDCRMEGSDARVVTFANGIVAKELIVALDDAERRLVWTAVGGRLAHHNASVQVQAAGDASCRIEWIADLLPNELAPAIAAMIEQGLAAMKRTAEADVLRG